MSVGHYENFPVASVLLPAALRRPVTLIYRFARSADDFADEGDLRPQLAFIGEIVRRARESVNNRHGVAQRRRKQHGSDRKVFVMTDRHCPIFQRVSAFLG